MKAFISLTLIIGFVFFLRVNLPPNDIPTNLATKQDTNVFESLLLQGTMNDAVAEWQRIDFIVIKLACSEHLKIKLIAQPFSKWQVLEKDIQSCSWFS